MTPVAPLVALRATTWDAALEETLSSTAHARALGDLSVHSVHSRVVNIRCGDELIALADDRLDDAPWTVRIPTDGWSVLRPRVGDRVETGHGCLVVHAAGVAVRILLDPDDRRNAVAADGEPAITALRDARAALSGFTSPSRATAFGRASAQALDTGVERMRVAAAARVRGDGADESIIEAARRLIGLGEGLTPSGDDILTGLAFVAAHPGFGLTPLLAPLSYAARAGAQATTLLSVVTLRAALAGRARRRMHDLVESVILGSTDRTISAAVEIAAIGHTSGLDLLTGIRLGIDLAEISYACARTSIETPEGES